MAKDPAFLFYSKDWLEGTAELLPEEKGVYIDLLVHQHQKGSLPIDTVRLARLVSIGHDDFLRIWSVIKCKFQQEDNRLVNHKLNHVMTERSKKAKRNTISGTWAAVLRLSKLPTETAAQLKREFKIDDFIDIEQPFLTNKITEWLHQRSKSIATATANENANSIIEGGTGETKQVYSTVTCETLMDVDLLAQKVFLDKLFVETFCRLQLDEDAVLEWLYAFNRFLRHGDPDVLKTEKDYRWHFSNWLPMQDYMNKKPQDYSPVKNNYERNSGNKKSVAQAHEAHTGL